MSANAEIFLVRSIQMKMKINPRGFFNSLFIVEEKEIE